MAEYPLALPRHSRVEDLVIDTVLGQGAFGITYVAHDEALGTSYALKEYLPRECATRGAGISVRPLSPEDRTAFTNGMERFLGEGRMVAPLDHPNVVKVLRLIRANGTAYLQMPYYKGEPLSNLLKRGGTFSNAEVRSLLDPLLDALEYIHGKGVTHRDIKPSNIYLTTGAPILLDFGAARIFAGDGTEAHTAMGSEGYAALEQSSTRGKFGPWTDIYGLSATFYRLITGAIPIAAATRADETYHGNPDPLPSIASVAGTTHSRGLLNAIDFGLAIRASDRPQTINEWRPSFREDAAPHRPPAGRRDDHRTRDDAEPEGRPWGAYSAVAVIALLILAGGVYVITSGSSKIPNPKTTTEAETPQPSSADDEKAWIRAYSADTAHSYKKYLDDFPNGAQAELARQQLSNYEKQHWERLQGSESIEAYEEYAALYPDTLNAAAAQGKIDRLRLEAGAAAKEAAELTARDDAAWAEARNEGTSAAMDRYLTQYPQGTHAAEARSAKQTAKRAAEDRAAFQVASRTGTRTALQNYLNAFPSGRHAAEAMRRIDEMTMRPKKVFADCKGCPSMIVVASGSFEQGAPAGTEFSVSAERPTRQVRIARMFAIGRYEVTFEEWDLCVQDGGCAAVADGGWGRGRRPVINVSWNDAQRYADWLSKRSGQTYRLPSESEWEYAARAGEAGVWIGGGSSGLCGFGNGAGSETGAGWAHGYCSDKHGLSTAPRGAYKANAFGLYDVIGNVAEWTQDCANLSYVDAPANGDPWERGLCSSRVVRGGSWFHGPSKLRLSSRDRLKIKDANDFTGFRIAREVQ